MRDGSYSVRWSQSIRRGTALQDRRELLDFRPGVLGEGRGLAVINDRRLSREGPVKNIVVCVIVMSALVAGSGCAGQGDSVPIALALKPPTDKTAASSASTVNVLVTPFGDDRSDRTKLGVHRSFWGAPAPLTLKNGTVGEATAKGLAEYLTRKGWRVQYVPTGSRLNGGDVVISGKVLEASVDAHGMVGSTDIAAKNKIVVQAKSLSDGSSITDTISHNGTYSVFWYGPEDAEDILSEVMEKNFEKFVSQTQFDGPALRFR